MATQRVPQARDARPGTPEPRRLVVEPLETRALMAVLWGEWNGSRAEHGDRSPSLDADHGLAMDSRYASSSRGHNDGHSRTAMPANFGTREQSNHRSTAHRGLDRLKLDRQSLSSGRTANSADQRSESLLLVPSTTLVSLQPVSATTLVATTATPRINLVAIPVITVSSTIGTTQRSVRTSSAPTLQASHPLQTQNVTVGTAQSGNSSLTRSNTSLLGSGSSVVQRTTTPVNSIQIAIRPVSFGGSSSSTAARSSTAGANHPTAQFDWISGAVSGVSWVTETDGVRLTDPSNGDRSTTTDPTTTDPTTNRDQTTATNPFGGVVGWSTAPDFGKPWRKRNGSTTSELLSSDTVSAGSNSSPTDRSDISYLGLIELPFTDRAESQLSRSSDANSNAEDWLSQSEPILRGDRFVSGGDEKSDFDFSEPGAVRSWESMTEVEAADATSALESTDRADLADAAFVPGSEHELWGGLVAIGDDGRLELTGGSTSDTSSDQRSDGHSISATGSVGYGWSEVVVELDSVLSNAQSFQLVDGEASPSLADNTAHVDPAIPAASFSAAVPAPTAATHAGSPSSAAAAEQFHRPESRSE